MTHHAMRIMQDVEVWPSQPLQPRRVSSIASTEVEVRGAETWLLFSASELDPDGFLLLPDAFDLPEEFYLRELVDFDLSDDEALTAFAVRWGPLFIRRRRLARCA